jgi:putative transcriptional regulator
MRLAPVLLLLLLGAMPAGSASPTPTPETEHHATGLAGRLLVAEPGLADPNFDHTVVLMLHHDAEGALGLVVNRPYGKAPTAELLRRLGLDADTVEGETVIYYGGPVQPNVGMVVHSSEYARAATRRITADIAVTSDPAVLGDLAHGKGPRRAVSVLGYAGWAPGQLESELAQGSWFTLPADPALVFAPDPTRAWEAAFARKGVEL